MIAGRCGENLLSIILQRQKNLTSRAIAFPSCVQPCRERIHEHGGASSHGNDATLGLADRMDCDNRTRSLTEEIAMQLVSSSSSVCDS